MQYWGESSKRQNDLCSFPSQTIQRHSNPNLCPNHWCQRSWSWLVLRRLTTPSRMNTKNRCPFHHRELECKSRKSKDTRSNRQVWPWSTKWSRAMANKSFVKRIHWSWQTPFFQEPKSQLYTWISPKSDWLYSLQLKMEKLYTLGKNKTWSWLWLKSWAPYRNIQA